MRDLRPIDTFVNVLLLMPIQPIDQRQSQTQHLSNMSNRLICTKSINNRHKVNHEKKKNKLPIIIFSEIHLHFPTQHYTKTQPPLQKINSKRGQEKTSIHFVQNRRSIYYFKKIFGRLAEIYDITNYADYRGNVIICTQPYGEQGRIRHNADIYAIRKLCVFLDRKGYSVIIKPHPREKNLEKYEGLGCRIDLCNEVPLEAVLAGIYPKPAGIIGITTTTLMTAKLFWKIPTLSLARVIERESYQGRFVEEIDNFCRIFANIVQIPERIEDFRIG